MYFKSRRKTAGVSHFVFYYYYYRVIIETDCFFRGRDEDLQFFFLFTRRRILLFFDLPTERLIKIKKSIPKEERLELYLCRKSYYYYYHNKYRSRRPPFSSSTQWSMTSELRGCCRMFYNAFTSVVRMNYYNGRKLLFPLCTTFPQTLDQSSGPVFKYSKKKKKKSFDVR